MPIDKTKFLAQFKAETLDHLGRLSEGLLALERQADDTPLLQELMREAHTIKGSARMMGYDLTADIAYQMEECFERALQQQTQMTPVLFDVLFEALDTIESLFAEKPIRKARSIAPEGIQNLCHRIEIGFMQSSDGHEAQDTSEGDTVEIVNTPTDEVEDTSTVIMAPPLPTAKVESPAHSEVSEAPDHQADKDRTSESIRVNVEKIDKLANLSGEMLTCRIRLNELLKKVESQVNASEDLYKLCAESVQRLVELGDKIEFISSHMQDEILRLRMIPLANLFGLFPRTIRDLAQEHNKEVELKIQGEDTCLDKKIIEAMKSPLMHLLRNAVDHGLEHPEERIGNHKPGTGTISLNAYPSGSQVTIEVSDDGRGIDVEKIKQKALGLGVIDQRQAHLMTDEQAYRFLFHSGFTTKDTVTDTSGRGFGMDVVAKTIADLKGMIEVESKPGQGTRFIIKLPLTISIAENLLVHCGSDVFAIPIDHVCETIRIQLSQIETVNRQETVTIRNEMIPLVRINKLFSLPRRGIFEKRYYPVIVVQSVGSKIALLVDNIIGHQEIVIKPLGYPLKQVRNIAGGTVLGDGSVALILDIPSIVKNISNCTLNRNGAETRSDNPSENQRKHILLAEDTLTTAMLEKDVLESAGFNVTHALDGQEALDMAGNEHFDLIITDVLMPKMNGFELTQKIKQDSRFSEIPIIIVTTREGDEDIRKGMEAGAEAYILKKDFTSDTLLETIDRLIH